MSQPLSPDDGEALNAPVREPHPVPSPAPIREPDREPDREPIPEPGHGPQRDPDLDPDPAPDPEPEKAPDKAPDRDPDRPPDGEPVREPVRDGGGAAAPAKHSTKRIPNSRATAAGDRIFANIADPAPEVDTVPTGAHILIADDEPNILISLEYLMKREGYRVSVARDGKQALESILSERPALVLLYVMMPKKSGFEVCQEVRANDTVRETLILMLTAKGRDTDLAKGLGSGADAYMTKPFSTKELVLKVRAMLDEQRA